MIVLIEAQINGLRCITSDRVPIESNILGNVEYISLEQDAAYWAREVYRILNLKSKGRAVDLNIVQRAGYDINIESKKLREFYLSKVRLG